MKKPLKEGSVYCDKCDGTGVISFMFNNYNDLFTRTCPKCIGDGQLDWLENITGKKSSTEKHYQMMRELIKSEQWKLTLGK